MRKILYILLLLLSVACQNESHVFDDIIIEEQDEGKDTNVGIMVGFDTDVISDITINDLNLFFFDESDLLVRHDYHTDMDELATTRKLMDNGSYTLFAVFNTEENLLEILTRSDELPEIYLSNFIEDVKALYDEDTYPDMLTGMGRCEVSDSIVTVIIEIDQTPATDEISTLTLDFTYENKEFTPYTKSAATLQLRAVVEVFKQGTDTKVLRKTDFVDEADPQIDILLSEGDYDIRVWSDYVESSDVDYFYITTNTKSIRISPLDSYTAGSDYKDAFAGTGVISIGSGSTETLPYSLNRPFAKYKIVASDVEEYNEMRVEKDLPAIEDLQVKIVYEGYLPAAYDMTTKTLNGSEAGYSYTSSISELTDESMTLASDYVMVNGSGSSVVVGVYLLDADGEVVTAVTGNTISYQANNLTTITGNFLTSGKGGITIDTSWGDELNYEF